MHSFSIDSITGYTANDSRQYDETSQYYTTSRHHGPGHPVKEEYPDSPECRTPSPSDSGIDSSFSPRHGDVSPDNTQQILLQLSKKSEALVQPKVSHDKPTHSFIALISMAIQSSGKGKLLLGDIYRRQYDETSQYYTTSRHHGPGHPVKEEYPDSPECRTPSPSDSGIDSSFSPRHGDVSPDNTQQILLQLSKKSEALVQPKVSHDKPTHSFIALISMAIQSSGKGKLLLGDIYRYVMDNFPYYNSEEKAWRNSIRYNLTINECFTKAGRSDGGNGNGNYWAIHPAVVDDFANGDYRRRQTKRKSRRKTKSSGGDVGLSSVKSTGYVTMTSTPVGYHPYGTTAQHLRGHISPLGLATSGWQQATSPVIPELMGYTSNGRYMPNSGYTPNGGCSTNSGYTPNGRYAPNGGYSDDYLNYTPTSSGYFNHPATTSYDVMAPQSTTYDYTNTSGLLLPVSTSHAGAITYSAL